MCKTILFVCLNWMICLGAQALETDQFVILNRELPDLRESLNQHVNATVDETLLEVNRDQKKQAWSCDRVHKRSIQKFRGMFIHKIEHWLEKEQSEKIYPPTKVPFNGSSKLSIYHYPLDVVQAFIPLGRNLRIGEIYMGADKLAHFFSTGLRYYEKYQEGIAQGMTDEEAKIHAIEFGIHLENTILGFWPGGVYSFGDLEANYQGLLSNIDFCSQENPMIENKDGKWQRVRDYDIGKYMTPYLDETFNPSFYAKKAWFKVKRKLYRQCENYQGLLASRRMKKYNDLSSAEKSFSVLYLEKLEGVEKRVPDRSLRRSLWAVCPEINEIVKK